MGICFSTEIKEFTGIFCSYFYINKLWNLSFQGRTIRHIVIAYALAFALMIVLGLFVNNGGTACEILANLTMIMFVVAYLKLFTLCVELWIMIVYA